MLFIAANPPDTSRLAIEVELRNIRQALQQADHGDQFALIAEWAIRPSDIQELILRHQPQILHFSGHNVTAAERSSVAARPGTREFTTRLLRRREVERSSGGLLVRGVDERAVEVPPEALRELLAQFSTMIRCVVLNACETHHQADALARELDFVVGTSSALNDDAAAAFSASFYRALAFGQTIASAFKLGRNAISLVGLPDAAIPQLFSRDGGPTPDQFTFVGEALDQDPEHHDLASRDPEPPRTDNTSRVRGNARRHASTPSPALEANAPPRATTTARPIAARAPRRTSTQERAFPTRLDPFPGRARLPPALRNLDRPRLDIFGTREGDRVRWEYTTPERAGVVHAREARGLQALHERSRLLFARPDGDLARRLGQSLSRFLFGDPDDPGYELVFRALLNRGGRASRLRTGPSHVAARCRIHADDATLLALPWSLVAEGDEWYADDGWSFELGRSRRARRSVRLRGPCTILVIAPRSTGANLSPIPHYEDIQDVLVRAWPLVGSAGLDQHVELARTWSEIVRLLRVRKPEIVYYYGRASSVGRTPCIRLDLPGHGHEDIELSALLEQLSGRARVLYLNSDSRRPLDLGGVDTSALPCVITPGMPHAGPEADAAGTQWLWMMLKQGREPVDALHDVLREQSTLRAGWMSAHTSYGEWITDVAPSEDFSGRARLRVDRAAQRSQMLESIRLLASHPTRLVESFIVCGEDAYSMRNLGDLLYQHIHDFGPANVRVVRNRLALPRDRQDMFERLRDLLAEEILELEPGESVARGVHRKLAELPARHGTRKVLWLDWGTVGRGTTSPALQVRALVEWLRFATEELGAQCPADVRVISMLSISASARGCERIEQYLDDLIPRRHAALVYSSTAHYTRLPRPGAVSKRDLIDFLDKYSSCPKDLVNTIAGVVHARTSGQFELVVREIESVETGATTWTDLARSDDGANDRAIADDYNEDELIQ
ncbi:MAG: CHAT domain-containing protein [Myxococcales bacterium]|nr:CHAT domain-containing protein [Myxococcales bacterium]